MAASSGQRLAFEDDGSAQSSRVPRNLHTIAMKQHALRLFNAVGRKAQFPIDQAADEGLIVDRA